MNKPRPSNPDNSITVIKTAHCPSLSGKSSLTYQLGFKPTEKGDPALFFRIQSNTGNGYFSDNWVPATDLHEAIEQAPGNGLLCATSLLGLFQGKSINTSGFLLAVLKHEQLIDKSPRSKRYYERCNSDRFTAEVHTAIDNLQNGEVIAKAAKPVKPAIKSPKKGKPSKSLSVPCSPCPQVPSRPLP